MSFFDELARRLSMLFHRRLLRCWRTFHPYGQSCPCPVRGTAAYRAYPLEIRQGRTALVFGADESGGARAAAWSLSGCITARDHDAGSSAAAAS